MMASYGRTTDRFGAVVRFALACTLSAAGILPSNPGLVHAEELSPQVDAACDVIAAKTAATHIALAPDEYSFYTEGSGRWATSGPLRWNAAFLPGNLWLEYQRTGATWWRDAAIARQAPLEQNKAITAYHDIGFLLLESFRNGYRSTGDRASRDVLLEGAGSLSTRYDPVVGMVQSKGGTQDFRVIIDTMMNIELLYWGAGNGGDAAWAAQATSHAQRTMTDFLRPDGGSYHYVAYDRGTGAVTDKGQGQGYADETTWSRGQAWIIYGLSVAYRETGDERFLRGAHRASDYWRSHIPTDNVPYWDFDAPDIPHEPRDSSAAAVAASAFVELGRLDPDPIRRVEYLDMARDTLETLSSPAYLSEDPSFAAALQHGTYAKMLGYYDSGLSWGDYYFAEAIARLRTQVTRYSGPDRYETALRAAQLSFASADTVVVASGSGFADALSASSLAGIYDAPVLLTAPTRLANGVAQEIERLGASRVVIVGGTAAVSADVEAALSNIGDLTVERISGRDRYEVSATVAQRVMAVRGDAFSGRVFLVRGDVYADALAVSPVAYASGTPVVLTKPDVLSAPAEQVVRAPGVRDVTVVGGERAVSAAVVARIVLADYAAVERVADANRYSTAAAFAVWAIDRELAADECIGIATGATFPDALSGGAAVGARRGVLLLTESHALPWSTASVLRTVTDPDTDVLVLGGAIRISEYVEEQIRQTLPER